LEQPDSHSGQAIGHRPYITFTRHQDVARKRVTSHSIALSRPDITPPWICHEKSTPSFTHADIVA
jgi:hypothetical protein